MIKIKGTINNKGEVVFRCGKPLPFSSLYHIQTSQLPVEVGLELSIKVGLDTLISGIDGFVWATKDFNQAEIIYNALKVQKIAVKIVSDEFEKNDLYLLKVDRAEDLEKVLDFIQNDVGGLRLKRDWDYPEGERNQSFEQWINE
jgi:hypothetical protein